MLLLLLLPLLANGQVLELRVSPPFNYVAEDWGVGRALPELAICADYSGARTLGLELTNGDPLGHFRVSPINESCWTLVLQKPLDADQVNVDGSKGQEFSLAMRVSDGSVLTFANLDVQVLDENDNAPTFVNTETAVSVREDSEPGSVLFTVSTTDPDTGVGNINDFALRDSFGGKFSIEKAGCGDGQCSGNVVLNSQLNYDLRNVYTLEVLATDGAGRIERVNTASLKVTVNVVDTQNSPPRFITDNRIQYVKEDTPVNSSVFLVEAMDGDEGVASPNKIRYSLKGPSPYFSVHPYSGWVFLVAKLDRESPDILAANGALSLTVVATEEEADGRSGGASELGLTVLVEDVDDERPRCSRHLYTAAVLENSAPLSPLTFPEELYVFDKDLGEYGEFRVRLAGDADSWLDVSPKVVYQEANLRIRVKDPGDRLDFERNRLLKFQVILTPKNGRGESSCNVELHIRDANDNPPRFNQSSFQGTVRENLPTGSFVAKVTAVDDDVDESGAGVEFALTGPGADVFSINAAGIVRTARPLDREATQAFHLTVVAADEGGAGHRETAPLHIVVEDANDQAPAFLHDRYSAFLPENSLSFTQMPDGFFVKAIDLDAADSPNSNITYWIEPDSPGAANFTINPYSGQIVPKFPGVDRERLLGDDLSLSVRADDAGLPEALSGLTRVVIYINDTNDNAPVFERSLYSGAVSENSSWGDFVVQVTATDADRSEFNHRVAYRIVDVQDKFAIDAKTGVISVAKGASLDRDLAGTAEWALEVLAVDQGFPPRTARAAVNVHVTDTNNKPPAFTEKVYEVAVYEVAPVFTSLVNLTAYDPDDDANLEYRITGFMDAQNKEGRPVVIGVYNYSSLFALHASSGELYTVRSLDREEMGHITLVVQVEDLNASAGTKQTATALVDLTIMDVNDNHPVYTQPTYVKNIPENMELGAVVLSVTALDPDANTTVLYRLSDEADGLVHINRYSGELTVTGRIDFEEREWINFTVHASDTGSPPKSSAAPAALRVLDLNDNSPTFTPPAYNVSVRENAVPGTIVLQLSAEDRDSGSYGKVSYFLLSEGPSSAFSVDEDTGLLKVAGELDRERKSRHTLTIQLTYCVVFWAVDDYSGHVSPDSHEATAIVEVNVLDTNDNAPQWAANTPSSLQLTENDLGGHIVTTLQASDPDDEASGNGRIRYLIVGGNATLAGGAPMFRLEPQSGALRLAGDLRGRFGAYELVLQARDLGQPFPLATNISLPLTVLDYNDHRPAITSPKHMDSFPVPENEFSPDKVILRIEAVDEDDGANAELRFSIKKTTSNDDWKLVSVNGETGEVRLMGPLDREARPRLSLFALACDLADPPLCDEAEFLIDVVDRDDNCPAFPSANRSRELVVPEDLRPGTPVAAFAAAVDRDDDPRNAVVCYDIVKQEPEGAPFSIPDARVPEIITMTKLDRESQSAYNLIIRASDCQQNSICSDGGIPDGPVTRFDAADLSLIKVHVIVGDVNDNPPAFTQKAFRGGIQYDTKIGSRVTRVRAEDPDSLDVGRLRYSLVGPVKANLVSGSLGTARQPFFLNSSSGDITTNIVFLPAWKGSFEMSVKVNDSAGFEDTVTVSISLLSSEEQVELLFRAPPNAIWDKAHHIIQLLSSVTQSRATIDDVRVDDDAKEEAGSKVLVHFVDSEAAVIPVQRALRLLDSPGSVAEETDKELLIREYQLRYAGENSLPQADSAGGYGLYLALAGVSASLVLILVVLVGVWCAQNHRYRRKLRAATTIAFASSHDPLTLPNYDVPGTNLHSGTNPVWSGPLDPGYGHRGGGINYGMDFDEIGACERNSLDDADVPMKEALSSSSASSADSAHSSDRPFTTRAVTGFPRSLPSYSLSSAQPSSFHPPHRKAHAPPPPPSTSPPPAYPPNIMAALESTEL